MIFLGTGINIDLFQSCGHCWVFQICWHIECSTLIASAFRILNSSAAIPSPPLALLAEVLPKAHLTSHSRMSGCRWVTTPLWLSRSSRSFLYSSSMYSCHLLISSASVSAIVFFYWFASGDRINMISVTLSWLELSFVFNFSPFYLLKKLHKIFLVQLFNV